MARQKTKRLRRIFLLVGVGAAAAGVLAAGVIFVLAQELPTFDEIVNRQIPESTKIYDRTGTVLLYESGGNQRRTVVAYDQIPSSLKDATVAIEDERFWEEPAFDVRGIARALYVDITSGSAAQGASTITQQLARNAFLSPERTVTRKIKEILLAMRLNRYYTKDQILGLYLNEIPYGPTVYGVESAAETYFGVHVSELSLAQSAVLAALPKAPSHYSPWGSHVKELISRQKTVLNKMYALGKISKADLQAALAEPVSFQPQSEGSIKAPHFVMAALDYLTSKYGEDAVRAGGLRVTTTLDWSLQQAAETAVAAGAARNEALYQGTNAALVAEDPKTGHILALVGSRDFFDTAHEGNFDVATQGLRQPGSSLKPLVYLTAFEKGYTPDTVLFDVPTEFAAKNPACPPVVDFANTNKQCFHPQDFEPFQGPVSLRTALAQSVNVPSAKLLYLAGLPEVIETAHRFGLTTLTDPSQYGLSLVLGGGAVRLVDLVGAYSTLATEGVKHERASILEVKNAAGRVLESYRDTAAAVVDSEYPRLITNILADAKARSGLFQTSLALTVFPGYDVALKTGTSNDYRDAWVVGYTPFLAAGVWAGNNNNTPMQQHGGSILAAVPLWHDFMVEALKKYPPESFAPPDPFSSPKPLLNGVFAPGDPVHSILYSVDKNNPAGPPPQNPEDDPQFANWEAAVQAWVKSNAWVAPGVGTLSAEPSVHISKPADGETLSSLVSLKAALHAAAPLGAVNVYLNGALVHQFTGTFGTDYALDWSFTPAALNPQNTVEVEGVAANGSRVAGSVVFYH